MHLYPAYDLAQMTVASTGTGNLVLGSAMTGLLTFETAGCSTSAGGQEITYAIAGSTNSETNRGVYISSSTLLVRTSTVYRKTTNSDNPINAAITSLVSITAQPWDLKQSPTVSVLTIAGSGTYTPPLACVAIEIIGIGGGQGGDAPVGFSSQAVPGGTTTFVISSVLTLTAEGGSSAYGGIATGGNINNLSGQGGASFGTQIVTGLSYGGCGGNAIFGGGGRGGSTGSLSSGALRGQDGTLGGGGGSGAGAGTPSGLGGGAGGTFWHLEPISSISSDLSFEYMVGAGSCGIFGFSGSGDGGSGGDGALMIKEYYLG